MCESVLSTRLFRKNGIRITLDYRPKKVEKSSILKARFEKKNRRRRFLVEKSWILKARFEKNFDFGDFWCKKAVY